MELEAELLLEEVEVVVELVQLVEELIDLVELRLLEVVEPMGEVEVEPVSTGLEQSAVENCQPGECRSYGTFIAMETVDINTFKTLVEFLFGRGYTTQCFRSPTPSTAEF